MMQGLLLAIGLLTASLIELTVIHSLPAPWQGFPLLFIAGLILMYRRSDVLGALWLTLAGCIVTVLTEQLFSVIPFFVTGIIGVVLCRRFFSRRSFYGLVGLSTALATTLFLTTQLVAWLASTPPLLVTSFWWLLVLTLLGALLGNRLLAIIEAWYARTFFVRNV